MGNFMRLLRTWLAEQKEHAKLKETKKGYNWAKSELLSGKMTPQDVQIYYENPFDHTAFDDGAKECTDDLCSIGAVSDNRY